MAPEAITPAAGTWEPSPKSQTNWLHCCLCPERRKPLAERRWYRLTPPEDRLWCWECGATWAATLRHRELFPQFGVRR